MTFESTRRDLIFLGNENARTPCLKHRPFTLIKQLGHLRAPANPNHERRLRKWIDLSIREIEACKRANGKYEPAHCRVRPYRRARS